MKRKLFKHQKEALQLFLNKEKFALFMDMGTGKTLVPIVALEKLEGLDTVLIFSPKSIVFNWESEIHKFTKLKEYKIFKLQGNKAKVMETYRAIKSYSGLKIIIANFEKARLMDKYLMNLKPQFIVVDESHKVKNRNAQISKALYKIATKCKYRLIMTGTPTPNGYEDLFMQYKIMNSNILGVNWKQFEDDFIIKGGYMNYEIVGYKNEEILKNLMHQNCYIVRIEDCIDLPEQLPDLYLTCELNSKARKAYNDLRKEMIAQLDIVQENIPRKQLKALLRSNGIPYESNEPYEDLFLRANMFINQLTADLTITQYLRLQQISGGFITNNVGNSINIDKGKLGLLQDYLEGYKKPVVVICNFLEEIKLIHDTFKKTHRVECLTGSTKNRAEINKDFQEGKIDILILQISSGSVGLNLFRASRLIFYSWNYKYDDYVQAIARIKRNGQKEPWQIIHLITENTIDEKILKSIQLKRDRAEKLLTTDK
ncbi:helicase [Clostridium phage Clo-PEP-1]|nr:helicase [Clostridium phage Clo-PEP-1]